MSETRAPYLLKPDANHVIMDAGPPDIITVSRKELEQEHIHLMARIQQLRRLLGFPPLPTGSQQRKQHE
jgi:hypothetical protein